MATVEEKGMIPTVIVGVGGTGAEVLARVRRLVEETYGSLKNFPIIGFLLIDTDKDYKIASPEAGGSPLKDKEKHWARVGGRQVNEMLADMDNYPWINRWFPNELERNLTSLEAGAGQIRACGRFAFFCNYHDIRDKFRNAVRGIKGKENLMLDRYGIKVNTNAINVFVTGSLSGGTGSGTIIDIGYCIRDWIKEEGTPTVTAIVPMPNAFAGISVGDRVLANGYAAMVELSYFSDHRTEYVGQFSNSLADEIRSQRAPFDFTYLVGTKNGESDFKLEQIREMIAQNIFLDLTSDFSPHKRSIRDNIKGSWAQADPGGRGYPKNFMSFGLSSIEIPIAQIRTSLANRLSKDLIAWWLNESVQLPPQMLDLVRSDTLKGMRLTEAELIADISSAQDRPYLQVISQWVNEIRNEIATDNWLQCTQQGPNVFGSEKGKILRFVNEYLQPKVNAYRADHFRELSPDERLHGDYLQRMYNNRDESIKRGRKALEDEFYAILSDRVRGTKFADAFIVTVRQVFNDIEERFRRERDKVWSKNENNRQKQYESALADINEFKNKFGVTKQSKIEEYCEAALNGLEGSLIATIQRKARDLGLDVIARLREHLVILEGRFNRYVQRLTIARDYFQERSDRDAESADALEVNGIKLYDRNELNGLYQDLIEQFAGASESSKSRYEIGMDSLGSTLSTDILEQASPLWKETRQADEIMRLFDITEIPEVQEEDLREKIFDRNKQVIDRAPEDSRLKKDLAACDRLFKIYNDNAEITNNLRIAYNKSKPLILLNQAIMRGKDAGFTPALNANVAVLGGRNTTDPAAIKMLPLIQEFISNDEDIKPLGEPERYRIVFVQEIGGFSLRSIDGMRELRQSYQDWRGQMIVAKRAQLKGESRDLPIPVHIQKEPPFWDIFPEDPKIFNLVVLARALGVLRLEQNKRTKESAVRYVRRTAIGEENVDLASSWEEVSQVLEVKACREDREECDRQVKQILTSAETNAEKQILFKQFTDYLSQRELELEGGKDSPEYKREAAIVLDAIEQYKLKTEETKEESISEAVSPEPVDTSGEGEYSGNGNVKQPIDLPPPPASSDMMGELERLASLKEKGLLSDEEFQSAKRRLLGL
ncbi:tubulin-like doman-containing protein [Spirulina sp. 06S082]|uniref:tubulin-like doman-containing protein n=1 Tax=Spirulina sp. 06S082 TaxID=3110248 RepID=UPI002B1F3505|nr:tubulin-like doman-containing protein [Spirulina sp. 06S082]MEA5468414.1 tubulin-like doman-containing protein [Spirulina sp. 06S082]